MGYSSIFAAGFCCALAIRELMSIVMGYESSGMPFSLMTFMALRLKGFSEEWRQSNLHGD